MTESPTAVAVSSLLQTAATCHDNGDAAMQSDSERTDAGNDKRRCVCHLGDACQIMSTAFAVVQDPRGYYVVLPPSATHLRAAYCRYLCPHEEPKLDGGEFVVAVHHFHPLVIKQYFNKDINDRDEFDLLPLPVKTMTAKDRKALELPVDDRDRVLSPRTGIPAKNQFWVLPSYSFDMAHANLKQSMTCMQQFELDRCVRRMRREARRQKWESIVDQWQQTSSSNLAKSNNKAKDNAVKKSRPVTVSKAHSIAVPAKPSDVTMPAKPSVTVNPIVADAKELVTSKAEGNSKSKNPAVTKKPEERIVSCASPAFILHPQISPSRPPKPSPSTSTEEMDENDTAQNKGASILTAEELLESELGDDDTIPDLNSLEEPESFQTDSEQEMSPKIVTPANEDDNDAVEPLSTPEQTVVDKEQDSGSLSSLSAEGNAKPLDEEEEKSPAKKPGMGFWVPLTKDKVQPTVNVQAESPAPRAGAKFWVSLTTATKEPSKSLMERAQEAKNPLTKDNKEPSRSLKVNVQDAKKSLTKDIKKPSKILKESAQVVKKPLAKNNNEVSKSLKEREQKVKKIPVKAAEALPLTKDNKNPSKSLKERAQITKLPIKTAAPLAKQQARVVPKKSNEMPVCGQAAVLKQEETAAPKEAAESDAAEGSIVPPDINRAMHAASVSKKESVVSIPSKPSRTFRALVVGVYVCSFAFAGAWVLQCRDVLTSREEALA